MASEVEIVSSESGTYDADGQTPPRFVDETNQQDQGGSSSTDLGTDFPRSAFFLRAWTRPGAD